MVPISGYDCEKNVKVIEAVISAFPEHVLYRKARNFTRDTKKLMSVSESELVSDPAPASCSSAATRSRVEEEEVLEAVFTMVDCSSLSVPVVTASQNYSMEIYFSK